MVCQWLWRSQINGRGKYCHICWVSWCGRMCTFKTHLAGEKISLARRLQPLAPSHASSASAANSRQIRQDGRSRPVLISGRLLFACHHLVRQFCWTSHRSRHLSRLPLPKLADRYYTPTSFNHFVSAFTTYVASA